MLVYEQQRSELNAVTSACVLPLLLQYTGIQVYRYTGIYVLIGLASKEDQFMVYSPDAIINMQIAKIGKKPRRKTPLCESKTYRCTLKNESSYPAE